MSLVALQVQVSGHHVGVLERARSGLVRWLPDPSWELQGQHPRLGLHFLRAPGIQSAGTGLPPWFENLLPEQGSALRRRLTSELGLRVTDSFSLLSALGRDLPGAVKVSSGAPALTAPRRQGGEGPVATSLRFSLAGMQLKLSMSEKGERFALSSSGEDGKWIVKLPGRDYPELPEVEHATMAWAKAAGLEVPHHFVLPSSRLEGLPEGWGDHAPTAFAIARFDRRPLGGRLHHEDLCQALNILPDHKYGDSGAQQMSLDGVLALVVDACGVEEGERFARRVGFVITSGNDDAHLKNWSLFWGTAPRPKLSPCYDLVATVAWPRHGWGQPDGPRLALSIGQVSRFAKLNLATLKHHAQRAGHPWAADAVLDGIRRSMSAWLAVREEAPRCLRDALAEHWRRTPILRAVQAEG